MGMPISFEVGDVVTITEDNVVTMKNGNKSIHHYPSDKYLKDIEMFKGEVGVVTHRFRPGYEVTVRFGEKAFHAKDNYITKVG